MAPYARIQWNQPKNLACSIVTTLIVVCMCVHRSIGAPIPQIEVRALRWIGRMARLGMSSSFANRRQAVPYAEEANRGAAVGAWLFRRRRALAALASGHGMDRARGRQQLYGLWIQRCRYFEISAPVNLKLVRLPT